MNTQATLDIQMGQLWTDTLTWISDHTLQITIGAVAGTVIVGLLLGIKWLGLRICRSDPDHNHWRTVIGRIFAKTKFWFMLVLAARIVVGYAKAPPMVATTVETVFIVCAAIQVALWARELVLGLIEHRAGGIDSSSLGSAMGIIRLLVTIAIFIIAAIVVLDNLGVNVTGLVAGLGIGGIAIGLAAKGIFDDLFSALSIIFDKPFKRGDSIKWDQTSGTVEEIGLKTTRVRSVGGEEVIVSNTNLLNKELQNLTRLHRRRVVQQFGIVYQTDPVLCARVPDIVKEVVTAHDKCVFIRCGMILLGASSLDYELQFDVESQVWEDVFQARSTVLIALLARFNQEQIEFAYPTQTSFTAAPDGTFVLPYAEDEPRVAT